MVRIVIVIIERFILFFLTLGLTLSKELVCQKDSIIYFNIYCIITHGLFALIDFIIYIKISLTDKK